MKIRFNFILIIIAVLYVIHACSRGPKVIEPSDDMENNKAGSWAANALQPAQTNQDSTKLTSGDVHAIVVNEILPTARYVYLNVTEGSEKYWIATLKQPVTIGGKYYYSGGLLQRNFKSTEYDRFFEKVYLVSNLVAEDHGNNTGDSEQRATWKTSSTPTVSKSSDETVKSGLITIAELVNNSKRYEGKTVKISGKCVKINANIMNRNWIHLKDGSGDDFDLVITSDQYVQVGTDITISGTVVLNKDFGAGYRYDIILENGTLLP